MFELDVWNVAILVVAGSAAGAINTLAGGGMMITLPTMVFLGIPETVANGTSRLGILFQATSSALSYRRRGALELGHLKHVVPPVVVGATLGSVLGARLPDHVFRWIFGGVMFAFAGLLLRRPRPRDEAVRSEPNARYHRTLTRWLILVPVGIYGGMVQAGMGYVVLGAMTVGLGFSLMEANILKVAVIGAYTPIAVGVFLAYGQLNVFAGLVLAVGQAVGAWFGARLALERGVSLVRGVLLAVIVLSGLQLLGFWKWLGF
ncbi:MAG: sulfite exporter TauE/SafE family protein [Myxococcota bacterium]